MYKHTFYYFLGNKKYPEIYILHLRCHFFFDMNKLLNFHDQAKSSQNIQRKHKFGFSVFLLRVLFVFCDILKLKLSPCMPLSKIVMHVISNF